MNRTEKALWRRINGCLPGTSDRVENAASPGFPDAYADYERTSYWVELKIASENAAFDGEKVIRLLRPSQLVWLHRHVREGAMAFMIVGYKKGLVVYRVTFKNRFIDVDKVFSLIGVFNSENKLYFTSEMRRGIKHG